MSKRVSIIIPNYNGKHLLEKNLPSLLKTIRDGDEIIVIDDGSTDRSVQFIKDTYPEIKVLCLRENQGFVAACNYGVKNSANDLIYLLNNDVEVTENFLKPLLAYFVDNTVFAVNSTEISDISMNRDFGTLLTLRFKFGFLAYRYQRVKLPTEAIPAPFAHGGHALFDKEKFIQLGMFDTLFRPFNREDWDISYRAWKCGWKILLEPNSVVCHRPGTTITRQLSRKGYERINWKNHFLFIWKNITSLRLIIEHVLFLPFLLIFAVLSGKSQFAFGFFLALKQLPEVIRKRGLIKRKKYILSDYDVIKQFSVINKR